MDELASPRHSTWECGYRIEFSPKVPARDLSIRGCARLWVRCSEGWPSSENPGLKKDI
jgi:hypothetical protein